MRLGIFELFAGECDAASSVLSWLLALATAIDNSRGLGVLAFAASADDASGTQMSAPVCIANAISVGAVYDANIGFVSFGGCTDSTTAADQVACFSNSNETTDLFAPGAAITSDCLFNRPSTFYGTSQASPHAAACAADFLQAVPSLTPDEIETALKRTRVPVTDPKNGLTFPRIDCLGALGLLGLIPTPPPTSTPTATATPTPTPEPRAILQLVAGAVALAIIGQWRAIAKRRPEAP